MTANIVLAYGADGTADTAPTLSGGTLNSTFVSASMATALTAATGGQTGGALQLAAQNNYISTAAASTGVILPSAATVGVGGMVIVWNGGANPITVFGNGSDTIDGAAAATGVTLTNAKRCMYFVTAAATWHSAQMGVVSA